jgi:hypothetical protein
MSNDALLGEFNDLIDAYSQHRRYIDKARTQGEKFSSLVIEKVILDHEIKSGEVADKIIPLVPQIEAAIGEIDGEKAQIAEDSGAANEKMEELELRLAIGELDQDGFDAEGKDLKASLGTANTRTSELDSGREVLASALTQWTELADAAGQDSGAGGIPSAPVASEDADDSAGEAANGGGELPGFEDVSFGGDGGEPPAPDVEAVASGEEEADSGGFEDFSFSDDEQAPNIQLNVVDGGEQVAFAETSEDAEAEPEADASEASEGGDAQHALLLCQEGTTEEQVYPFSSDALTIGRGRDNDIQIKDDSKVSRFHCKLYKREANYYIEDNKSSNGTLVDGELITERKLDGGEEIIIGETFFRFRMM